MTLNTAECCWDGGDCWCPLCQETEGERAIYLGDEICDEELNNKACCYDGNDCLAQQKSEQALCPQCPMYLLKDLIKEPDKCHEHLNNPLCCYSLGNCRNSSTDHCISSGHRSHLQRQSYRNFYNHAVFRGCPLHLHKYLGDAVCDPIVAPFEEMCCYDGGDCIFEFWNYANQMCNTCPYDLKHYIPLLKESQCVPELNNFECCYSLGNCFDHCPTCSMYQVIFSVYFNGISSGAMIEFYTKDGQGYFGCRQFFVKCSSNYEIGRVVTTTKSDFYEAKKFLHGIQWSQCLTTNFNAFWHILVSSVQKFLNFEFRHFERCSLLNDLGNFFPKANICRFPFS